MFSLGIALASRTRVSVKLCGFALLLLAAAPAKAQTPVEFGDTISEPGVYFLNGNQSGSGPGIQIESDNVTLLLLRFTLRGNGTHVGISALGRDNVVIHGGRVTHFGVGIELFGGDYCTVKDTRIDHCAGSGLHLEGVDESWFLRLRCDYNGVHGVEAVGCDDNRFVSILSHDNGRDGILLDYAVPGLSAGFVSAGSDDNKVRLCWAAYNGRDGIGVRDSDENLLKSNECVGNEGAGIRLDTIFAVPSALTQNGAQDNHLEANWCVFNHDGIVAERSASNNTVIRNTALASQGHDMVDDNDEPPCPNTWFLNFFLTKDGRGEDCIF